MFLLRIVLQYYYNIVTVQVFGTILEPSNN